MYHRNSGRCIYGESRKFWRKDRTARPKYLSAAGEKRQNDDDRLGIPTWDTNREQAEASSQAGGRVLNRGISKIEGYRGTNDLGISDTRRQSKGIFYLIHYMKM